MFLSTLLSLMLLSASPASAEETSIFDQVSSKYRELSTYLLAEESTAAALEAGLVEMDASLPARKDAITIRAASPSKAQ